MIKSNLLFVLFLTTIFSGGQKCETDYLSFLSGIQTTQDSLRSAYLRSDSMEQNRIIENARIYLEETIRDSVFPFWYGTKWDFNGTTRTPGKGRIACGYFVTNILTDVGFDIPRIKWAQSPSEVFIKKLSHEIRRYSNSSISNVEAELLKMGNGLYLVGLDNHTGFVTVQNERVRFVHADYYDPEVGVVSEKLNSENPMANSSYWIIGKLFSDSMIRAWLNKRPLR